MSTQDHRYLNAYSVSPSRAVSYIIPEHWAVHGRQGSTRSDRPSMLTDEERKRKQRARVISRYWQAVGYLWLRSRRLQTQAKSGKVINHRQTFLTLTVPGVSTVDHNTLKKECLDKFWTWSRNVADLEHYIWTAELQKRQEIHFHAILNSTIPYQDVNDAWNRICANSGVIDMSKGDLSSSSKIEICRSAKGARAYAAKYLSKSLKSSTIQGRIWSGTHSVTGMGSITTNQADHEFDYDKINRELATNQHEWYSMDHGVSITNIDTFKLRRSTYPYIHRLFKRSIYDKDKARAERV